MSHRSNEALSNLVATPLTFARSSGAADDAPIPALFLSITQYKEIAKRHTAWTLSYPRREGGTLTAYAIKTGGRIGGRLAVTFEGPPGDDPDLWPALHAFAATQGASTLFLESIGPGAALPPFDHETYRDGAEAYVIDLRKDLRYSKNHIRNIKKAAKNDVTLVEQPLDVAIDTHVTLGALSGDRRRARGETVNHLADHPQTRHYLTTYGNARLYQAAVASTVVSSKLVIRIGDHAFYDTGGSTPEGMKLGASHFLMDVIINDLRTAGYRSLNLGVSTPNRPGLTRFKEGFDADRHAFALATLDIATAPARALNKLKGYLRRRGRQTVRQTG